VHDILAGGVSDAVKHLAQDALLLGGGIGRLLDADHAFFEIGEAAGGFVE
jgi:hypothetical protein